MNVNFRGEFNYRWKNYYKCKISQTHLYVFTRMKHDYRGLHSWSQSCDWKPTNTHGRYKAVRQLTSLRSSCTGNPFRVEGNGVRELKSFATQVSRTRYWYLNQIGPASCRLFRHSFAFSSSQRDSRDVANWYVQLECWKMTSEQVGEVMTSNAPLPADVDLSTAYDR